MISVNASSAPEASFPQLPGRSGQIMRVPRWGSYSAGKRILQPAVIAPLQPFVFDEDRIIRVGDTIELTPAIQPKLAATFSFGSSNEDIVTVSEDGMVTGVAKGSAMITIGATLKVIAIVIGTLAAVAGLAVLFCKVFRKYFKVELECGDCSACEEPEELDEEEEKVDEPEYIEENDDDLSPAAE